MTLNSNTTFLARIQDTLTRLIELAESGKINPWEVKVIEIIDEFLTELGLFDDHNISPENLDLGLAESAKVMLFASKLVLLKAETIAIIKEDKCQEWEENTSGENQEKKSRNTAFYELQEAEKYIKRKITPLLPQRRKVTLQEFIAQLKAIQKEISEKGENIKANPDRKPKKGDNRQEALETVKKLAHEENLTELTHQISVFLNDYKQSQGRRKILFEELVRQWQKHRGDSKQDRVGVFWALLLLSSQSKVELYQPEFYHDIEITLLD
ncbi:MAG: segregation/condensation protein A [Geminocystis sp.]|nr:segregation/condensation protein A [Geminocystis sp.]MCS7148755.1 segregation/condensation protein A [Geminocystis sp.]MDW8116096.1 segregation/condensation protein A [Geminocystis sp.]MDW8463564.1 segregation/condensation protein A [Geminocystis sp.]HIK38340.1 segregation/condensation protein A [Geminocystis sp. M7585_C2015_104]